MLDILAWLPSDLGLLAASAIAFYAAAVSVLPRLMRFAVKIPHAKGGEQIGAVIGESIGGIAQIFLILGAIASIDPTSEFPLRLSSHLSSESAT